MRILALDLGKYKTLACDDEAESPIRLTRNTLSPLWSNELLGAAARHWDQ